MSHTAEWIKGVTKKLAEQLSCLGPKSRVKKFTFDHLNGEDGEGSNYATGTHAIFRYMDTNKFIAMELDTGYLRTCTIAGKRIQIVPGPSINDCLESVGELVKKVKNLSTGTIWTISERVDLSEMERHCHKFFNNGATGKRETFQAYRGCIIVRNTVKFSGCAPERRTIAYLYGTCNEPSDKGFTTHCLSSEMGSVAQAKRLIDRVLDGGQFWFNMGLDDNPPERK